MRAIIFFEIAISSQLLFYSPQIWAHGDEQPSKTKETKVEVQPRQGPRDPKVLSQLDTAKMVTHEKLPEDVLIIKCTLSSFSTGRGLMVDLFDSLGNKLLEGHSGTDGYVGFEGLDSNRQYEVRIGGERYKGVASVTSGELSVLNGERQ